jgi:hypothetical protein
MGLLATIPPSMGSLRLDRCDPVTFRAAVSTALVADEELGLLVDHKGVVLVLA